MDDETFLQFNDWKNARKVQNGPAMSDGIIEHDLLSPSPTSSHHAAEGGVLPVGHHTELHSDKGFGPLIKPIIYGGMDGLVSVFVGVLVAAITGETLPVILSLSLAKLFAGAFSMGAGGYMSSRAEVDFAIGERKREEWEVENFKEGEVQEMINLYIEKGYAKEVAWRIVEILAKNDRVFIDAMMVEELQIPLDQAHQSPLKNMTVNFFAFMIFGIVPVLPFIIFIIGRAATCGSGAACIGSPWSSSLVPLFISIGISTVALVLLSIFKARVTGLRLAVSIVQAFVGAILSVGFGAGLGYAIYISTGSTN